jgi:hypothetical protein
LAPEGYADRFAVAVSPNPYESDFSIDVSSASESPVGFKVYDMLGRLVDSFTMATDQARTVRFGSGYASGVYSISAVQDGRLKTLRIIKK